MGNNPPNVCFHHEGMMEVLNSIRSTVTATQTQVASLQVVVTDVAVIKEKITTLEDEQCRIREAIFGDASKGNSLPERVSRVETVSKQVQEGNLGSRVARLEEIAVVEEDIKILYEKFLSAIWKLFIPLIVAFVVAAAGFAVNLYKENQASKAIESRTLELIRNLRVNEGVDLNFKPEK